ncbi:hypothetical protein LDVICp224 [lymphocystis disease virus-China]|uniref:Uncharacterized protein n=1 Tax=lymphocystis disease virus-China TaxID=256729 RepID=Q677P0_9VIRU|nr:hypothetical protein LDVICp224 [lymphocystis disease virus-China]AAU11067.1 hypothetical protein [lymphocystis disease virus-China]
MHADNSKRMFFSISMVYAIVIVSYIFKINTSSTIKRVSMLSIHKIS